MIYYHEPPQEARHEYLEEEKRVLERRLKEIDARLQEVSK
jgi:uncharacterized protein YydD (DUF2326 family)